jgi:general secretion pathway protein K
MMDGHAKPMGRRLARAPREAGVAVITALLLTTLAVAIVASLFWQQQVQVRSMENQRLHLQTQWVLRGALDWAMLVLRQDGIDHQDMTNLDQVWATPLAETRLDQYIERERVEGENFDATLSGNITDACSRYNLQNLASNGSVEPEQVALLRRLMQSLQIDPALAERAAAFVAAGQPVDVAALANNANNGNNGGNAGDGRAGVGGVGGAGGTGGTGGQPAGTTPQPTRPRDPKIGNPVKLLQVDDLLAVQGFTPAIVERLRPFVIVLPVSGTPVNVNTAPAEVLAALVQGMSVSEANALVVRRKQAPWRDLSYFHTELNGRQVAGNATDVKSQWFLVNSRIRLDRAALDAEALIHRPIGINSGSTAVQWIRQY